MIYSKQLASWCLKKTTKDVESMVEASFPIQICSYILKGIQRNFTRDSQGTLIIPFDKIEQVIHLKPSQLIKLTDASSLPLKMNF